MAGHHLLKWLPILLLPLSCQISFSSAAGATPSSTIKAVNLGGWLVTEGWIKPSLFDGIPNKDLLDGTQLQFKSLTQQMYLCAEDGGGTIIVANRTSASGWETFTLWRITESTFQFKVFDKQFVGLSSQGDGVVAVSTDPGQAETLEIVRNANDSKRVRIKASNGFFIQAKTDVLVTADYPESTSWGDDDPSVFQMTIVSTLQGEYQVTNGYGPDKAPQVMKDGTQVQFKSTAQQKYLTAENGGGTTIVANRPSPSGWETFKLWRITESTFNFRVFEGQFIGVSDQGVVAVETTPGSTETFEIVRNTDQNNRVRIKAPNGLYLQANSDGSVTANSQESTSWGDDDPSVFLMNNFNQLRGEYQITNGYGPEKAKQVMTEHWNSYIVEDDFRFMSQHGLNAVRIPVGWWTASDPNPPKPFVGGSLQALDNAFTWAENNNIKVIVDLHAAPGSQNGNEHSGTRDGSLEWGDSYIDQTVKVIDFFASRYAQRRGLLAIELMNEPTAPGVRLETLKNYYRAGYDAVRKHTSTANVIMSNRLSISDPTELIQFASGFQGSVIDVHYYNLFSDMFKGWTAQRNIDYVYNDRANELKKLTTSNGPLVFVGEWVAEWELRDAPKADYRKFANAQLDVYGRATFGWAYWTLKNVNEHWSLKRMINDGIIEIKPSG